MDIEDIISKKNDNEKNLEFTKELAKKSYNSREEYDKYFVFLRKKYKINPKKTIIRRLIKNIDQENITKSFLKYSIRKIGKSSSGVAVFTVLTSPFPEYEEDGEIKKQNFSCAQNCAYCPDEPEVTIQLEIIDIIDDNHFKVKSDIDLNHIRIINHIIFKDKKIIVNDCFNFEKHTFIVKIKNHIFSIKDNIIGVKIAQPRSYISSEPAVLRAGRNQFIVIDQMHDRANVLNMMGHPIDKIEVIILGGTWDHYPLKYREQFIRDIYYSMNVFNKHLREKLSLEEEIKINEKAESRIIGITTETRPDCITVRQIKNLRKMNITRVQLGVQHFDDKVLEFINRGCYLDDTIKSNYILKQNGYKLDMHLMPDLPGSSIENDFKMYEQLFSHKKEYISKNHIKYVLDYPELQADQLKIYPCSTVPYTDIKKWYDEGSYKPYSEDKDVLIKVILYIKKNVFPWIRLNRIIRDIPLNWIDGGNKDVNLRQYLLKHMKEEGLKCKCIRCREVGSKEIDINKAELFIREYNGVNATEYFISYETPDNDIIFGFIRLRINHTNDNIYHKDLIDNAFIRELHVYGSLSKHNEKGKNVQHKGFGKNLLKEAEKLVQKHNINKISIISGVGVREYYEKNGYTLNNNTQYMEKYINTNIDIYYEYFIISLIILIMISMLFDLNVHSYLLKIHYNNDILKNLKNHSDQWNYH
jgi:ELP3 family radical SAM enzyme/protein acetyltransferase